MEKKLHEWAKPGPVRVRCGFGALIWRMHDSSEFPIWSGGALGAVWDPMDRCWGAVEWDTEGKCLDNKSGSWDLVPPGE
jgi:hypothetical protein